MKILQKLILLCGVCVGVWAVEPISKVELIERATLAEAIAALDVNKVTGSLARLQAAHAHVDLAPLLEKLRSAKPLARRWPAKLVAGGGGLGAFFVFATMFDDILGRDIGPAVFLAGDLFGAYTCYKAYIRARIRRARKILDALLTSPAIAVSDVTAARKALFDVARLSGISSEEMVRLCGAIDAKVVRT